MVADSQRKWPDSWVLDALRSAGALDDVAEARLAGSDSPTAWAACLRGEVVAADTILAALSKRFGMPVANMATLDPDASRRLPGDLARRLKVVPLRVVNRTLEVACSDPISPSLENEVAFAADQRVRLFLADPPTVLAALDALYPSMDGLVNAVDLNPDEHILRELSSWSGGAAPEASTSDIVDALIVRAARRGASDVHLEPHEHHFGIRYRIDGVLHEIARVPRSLGPPITSRIKVLANLDIADRLRPQDGRAHVKVDGRQIDLRISTLPVGGLGEKTVVRLLDQGAGVRTLASLGYDAEELRRVEYLMRGHEGFVLVSGPTGSGKTTTLYAALRSIQTPGINIVTVEDPVEYRLSGVAQVQVNDRAGLTFSSALRSILRQDPDVVLVGEIRDHPTAEIALQASLTGHLVLSTVHANDAPSTITRLVDIGVDPAALAGALKGVIAQRLLRRLCPECRIPCDVTQLAEQQRRLLRGIDDVSLYLAGGCEECGGTGYRGRIVISEIALVTAPVERAITTGASVEEIARHCAEGGMLSFWERGLISVARGDTSLNELLDNIYPPMLDEEGKSKPADDASPGTGSSDASEPASTATTGGAALDQSDVDDIFGAATRLVRQEKPTPPAARPRRDDRPSVLLIDDDAEARRAFRAGLEREGFRVTEAADGEAGLEYVRRIQPDIVVTELTLPKLDGFGLLRAISAESMSSVQVLVLTSNDEPSLTSWAMELGALEVLIKPVDPRVLGSRLHSLWAGAA